MSIEWRGMDRAMDEQQRRQERKTLGIGVLVLVAGFAAGYLGGLDRMEGERPSVGGTPIPAWLHCQEDEVIGFDGVPDTLECIHIEQIGNGR